MVYFYGLLWSTAEQWGTLGGAYTEHVLSPLSHRGNFVMVNIKHFKSWMPHLKQKTFLSRLEVMIIYLLRRQQ